VVKSQVTDIIDLVLQLIRHPNNVHRSCHHRKSRGTVLSTAAVRWATTKFDGVWNILDNLGQVFFAVLILTSIMQGIDNINLLVLVFGVIDVVMCWTGSVILAKRKDR
jgi:hypothetical protein